MHAMSVLFPGNEEFLSDEEICQSDRQSPRRHSHSHPAGCEAREAEGTGAAEQMLHGRATARTLSLTID